MERPGQKTAVAGLDLARYVGSMFRKRTALCLASLAFLFGCGDGTTSFEAANPALEAASTAGRPTEVEVLGNLVVGDAKEMPLVFVFADLSRNAVLAEHEPINVGSVGASGRFSLSVPPAEKLAVVFLADAAHDGVIDPGDATALLLDPEQQLSGLEAGDRVLVSDIQPDFTAGKAVAAGFAVEKASAPEPAATPTAPSP
jgi:hypothetical protein